MRTRIALATMIVALSASVSFTTTEATAQADQNECHPNYAGACVPIAFDVDCAGGSGDGPAYVEGPFQVVGQDVYELDRDSDGIGCESAG